MKRRKLKVKNIIILSVLLLFFLFVFMSPLIFINVKLIGNNQVQLDYGEKYSESGYKASAFGSNVTDKVVVTDNIKDEIGNYEVNYEYSFLFYKVKKTRKVSISDLSEPEITLNGDKSMSITINSTYEEPGFVAVDKLDGDLTQDVVVTNNVDINTLGEYDIVYEVKDKAGNVSKEIRKVKVERMNPTQMSIKEYTLDGWYDSVKLKKTEDYGDDYFNSITYVGDSNVKNMYLNGVLKGINAWAIPCLHAEAMKSSNINLYGLGIEMKLLDAVEKYKPKTMILNFGTFSTTWLEEEYFISAANYIIEQIKVKSPDTKIILISIYPVIKGESCNKFDQKVINKYNYLILEMANKYDLKYLDVQEVLKGEDGYGKSDYYVADKFHLNSLGHRVVREYIKTHALKED